MSEYMKKTICSLLETASHWQPLPEQPGVDIPSRDEIFKESVYAKMPERKDTMDKEKATAIFYNISSGEYSDMEKVEAISQVVRMETHNGITKDAMLGVIEWLLYNGFGELIKKKNAGPKFWLR